MSICFAPDRWQCACTTLPPPGGLGGGAELLFVTHYPHLAASEAARALVRTSLPPPGGLGGGAGPCSYHTTYTSWPRRQRGLLLAQHYPAMPAMPSRRQKEEIGAGKGSGAGRSCGGGCRGGRRGGFFGCSLGGGSDCGRGFRGPGLQPRGGLCSRAVGGRGSDGLWCLGRAGRAVGGFRSRRVCPSARPSLLRWGRGGGVPCCFRLL